SHGINRGIIQAHRDGILTSASLLVDRPASGAAAALARQHPHVSVGLHLELDAGDSEAEGVAAQCERQLARFRELTGTLPTHVDSHHDVHLAPRVGAPVRGRSGARHVGKFYGHWGRATHPEQIGVEGLLRLLDADVREGVTERSCHPGYVEPDFRSSYLVERELELRTLCDARVRQAVRDRRIQLIGFHDLPARATAATLAAEAT